jgi:hypothetical protein
MSKKISTKDPRPAKHYTHDEWKARAVELFGEDPMLWRFRCPICSNVQSPESLRKYKEKGAEPSDAYQACEGRLAGGKTNFASEGEGVGCDYAAFGLLRLGDFVGDTPVFPFDEVKP